MRFKYFAAAIAVTAPLAAGLATAGTANAATPACSQSTGNFSIPPAATTTYVDCIDIFMKTFGRKFLLDDYKRVQTPGAELIEFNASVEDPALDFSIINIATTTDYYHGGLASLAVTQAYPAYPAGEIEYSPYGVSTGECVAVLGTASAGTPVTLQPCGASAGSTWVLLYGNVTAGLASYAFGTDSGGLANGSSSALSVTGSVIPDMLTYPVGGYPTDKPRPQFETEPLTGATTLTGPAPVISQQRFDAFTGEVNY